MIQELKYEECDLGGKKCDLINKYEKSGLGTKVQII